MDEVDHVLNASLGFPRFLVLVPQGNRQVLSPTHGSCICPVTTQQSCFSSCRVLANAYVPERFHDQKGV